MTRRDPGGRNPATGAGRREALVAAGVLAVALLAALVVLAATLGGGDAEEDTVAGGQPAAAPAGHIHGLGVDPRDRALLIATHGGLFRAPEGSRRARRVGTSDRDLMGFSVVAPGHFLASGHPGSESQLPPNLGLVESRDGGRTWRPLSLLGEADFHVLRVAGRRVYGFDGANGRFMVSSDGGRTWAERGVPAVPIDLAVHPEDRDHLVVATDSGLRESRDAGRSWSAVSEEVALLAWPRPNRLFLLAADGRVRLSTDGGRTARPAGRVHGQPVAFMATEDALYVGLADGIVARSTDGGSTFAVRAQL